MKIRSNETRNTFEHPELRMRNSDETGDWFYVLTYVLNLPRSQYLFSASTTYREAVNDALIDLDDYWSSYEH